MDAQEIRKSAALEKKHWWYAERRALVRRLVRPLPPGRALDVGCGGGGNTGVLRDLGWDVTGIEYSPVAASIARGRDLKVVRGDAQSLPVADASMDLVMSTDAWEHIEDDKAVASETARVLRPGGRVLVAVPCSMALWSGHDVALGHLRRYERADLASLLEGAGLEVVDIRSWNVLLRPVARMRRKNNESESEMEEVHPVLNAGLRAAVASERFLPVHRLPGISLVARAVKR
ncbi:methyltransferase domain-containing protein [Nocardioides sp. dk4132]|uniref:class I SAM-dependent methyltransferase n=1 Tax=unclassified Nocardioides TaxID=2615069 RepID=UPI00129772EF|nr:MULTISPECIES: class I SAM-dependent methyltransferase [unclassified Nocardioides]MQW76405.1 methyltransferase domain-containing protein [Nocardioides sp. dk4132]QGA07321.1 methyltransferase domain-containing protein [Nocardioides sp. dk884]